VYTHQEGLDANAADALGRDHHKNEEANLARTLASVQFADEIVVLDSAPPTARSKVAPLQRQVYDEPWKGFAAPKNSAIAKCTGTWILSRRRRGADPELQAQISYSPHNRPPTPTTSSAATFSSAAGSSMAASTPTPKLRLFRRAAANFTSPPQFEDRPVHETIASTARPHARLRPHPPRLSDARSYIEHMDRYSTLGCSLLVAAGKVSRSWPAFVCNVFSSRSSR